MKAIVKGIQITLLWSSTPTALSCKVYYKAENGKQMMITTKSNKLLLKKLQKQTRYRIKVTALNKAGESAASKELVITTGK